MKKFKLIKEYPGSPKLGTIATEIAPYMYQYKNTFGTIKNIFNLHTYPEFWQEIVEKDYEILYILGIDNKIIPYLTKTECINYLIQSGFKIHSVKRLSDGEIFTIGDKITGKSKYNCTINTIELNPDYPQIIFNRFDEGIDLINAKHIKKPLFTTEDGVDIYVGDNYFELIIPGFHNAQCVWNILPYEGRCNLIYDQEGNRKHFRLWFSTKEKAEEYILMNKPCLSLNDIFNTVTWLDNSKKLLKELVKQKLKQ